MIRRIPKYLLMGLLSFAWAAATASATPLLSKDGKDRDALSDKFFLSNDQAMEAPAPPGWYAEEMTFGGLLLANKDVPESAFRGFYANFPTTRMKPVPLSRIPMLLRDWEPPVPVVETDTVLLAGTGLLGLWIARRLRRRIG